MNAEVFAEWLRRQRHHVVRTASSYWFDQGPRAYQAFPYHWLISPSDGEIDALMTGHGAIAVRYSTPFDAPEGKISYHAILEKQSYELDSLGKWARKNVRRGLKNCSVEPISFQQLASEGWALQVDTLGRQGRRLTVTQEEWRCRCLAAGDLPGFEAWAALVDGNVAASVMTFLMDDCIYILYQQCRREYLQQHVNNALGFTVTQTVLGRPGVRSILYGLHSLDAPSSVDEFKFRMGYVPRPVRQRVVIHPWLSPLLGRTSHWCLRRALALRPGSALLAKAEGMLRFYLEGRYPPDLQDVPPCLTEDGLALAEA